MSADGRAGCLHATLLAVTVLSTRCAPYEAPEVPLLTPTGEAGACGAAMVAAIAMDAREGGDLTYLLDGEGSPACEAAIDGAVALAREHGFDAFLWDEGSFGRRRVFCNPGRRCCPVAGAVRVGAGRVVPAAQPSDDGGRLRLVDAPCDNSPSEAFDFRVEMLMGKGPSYDMSVRCVADRWSVTARRRFIVW